MTGNARHHRMRRRLLKWVAVWVGVIAVPTVALQLPGQKWVDKPQAIPVDAVAQIVPAVVIAIFVFAVGTAFVVAQIVPPARGTRAVTMLRRSKLEGAIAPAPVLLAGSAFLIVESGIEEELAVALTLGSVLYTVFALQTMLTTLVEATDPAKFRVALEESAEKSRTTEQLYDSLRTTRGWIRVAARSNDSRELQESLECLLKLVEQYASHPLTDRPEAYTRHKDQLHNPLRLHDRMKSSAAHLEDSSARPWFADEVGRAVRRATELALQSQTLLDRDTSRLLNTLTNAAALFYRKADKRSTNVMLQYLVEVGLGARHCPPDRLEWYLEPCVRLACLHQEYSDDDQAKHLSVTAAAGVLLIAEAFVTAKEPHEDTEVVGMLWRAISPAQHLQSVVHPYQRDEAVAYALSGDLEPRERAATYQVNKTRLGAIANALSGLRGGLGEGVVEDGQAFSGLFHRDGQGWD